MSTDLSRLQRAMQHSIVTRGIASTPCAGTVKDAAQRLGIYAIAYRVRLQDALAHNFPMLQLALGVERFGEVAAGYLETHPSRHMSVRAFGAKLSEWLHAHQPSEPWFAELAGFEWALADAFDAPDQTAINIETLAALDPARWPDLRLNFAAAVQRLTLATNAAELYAQASREELASEGRITVQPSEWLIWRDALTARYRSIDEVEATALDALRSGSTFAQMCEELFDRYESESVPMQAAALLKRWIADGLIVQMNLLP